MMSQQRSELPCDTIIFLIHPCCYEALSPEQVRHDNMQPFVRSEAAAKQRWLHALRQRPPQTLYAQLGGPAYLWEAAAASLGRAFALRFTTPFPPSESLHEYYLGLAEELRRHVADHHLALDYTTVGAQLWGESFEGCVPGYGGAFAEYLPLTRPPVMRFEMTVHDSLFLHGHLRHETVPIAGTDVEAWVFACHDGSAVAMFQARSHAQWLDRRRVSLQLDDRRLQVCTKLGHTVWPEQPWYKGKPEQVLEFEMELKDCIWHWVRSVRMPFDELCQVVAAAEVRAPVAAAKPEDSGAVRAAS